MIRVFALFPKILAWEIPPRATLSLMKIESNITSRCDVTDDVIFVKNVFTLHAI